MFMEEIEAEVTTLYYMQRVNFEAADEVSDRARPLWAKVVKSRLSEVATEPSTRTSTRSLYNRRWDASGTIHERTKMLAAFLEPDMWPNFFYDGEDTAAKEKINVWTELIGLSPESVEADAAIRSTGMSIRQQLNKGERLVMTNAAEGIGWYATVSTSRRNTTGWIVRGKGKTLYVLRDPLSGIRRIATSNGYSVKHTDKRVAPWLSGVTETTLPTEPEKYTLSTASVTLLYPPDMAAERKEWVSATLAKVDVARAKAKPVWEAFTKWKAEADPLIRKTEVYAQWMRGLPEEPAKVWSEEAGQLRWIHGAAEAIAVLFTATGWTEEELRTQIVREYQARRPEYLLTPAEQAVIDAKPAVGSESLSQCVAEVLVADFPGLAALF